MSKTLRITKLDAERIVEAAVADSIRTLLEETQKRENALVERVVRYILSREGQCKEFEIALKLNRSWLTLSGSASVKVRGTYIDLKPRSVGGKPGPIVPARISSMDRSINDNDRLAGDIFDHDTARTEVEDHTRMLQSRVTGLLAQATTYGKLAEIWPEGEPYWGPFREKAQLRSSSRVPTVKVDEVNQLLGLSKLGVRDRTHAA